MFSYTLLEEMSRVNLEGIDKSGLVNIQEVRTDASLPAPDRMGRYLEQIKNPYCFLCGETPVKVCFSPEGDGLDELLRRYFIALK